MTPQAWGKADIHIHSSHGDGMGSVPQLLDFVARQTDLDVIAVTDHDDIEGSLRARQLAVRGGYPFELVTGMEVTTREGHLLALFIEEPVRSLRSLRQTAEDVHRLGGVCVVPHPMSWLTRSAGQRSLDRMFDNDQVGLLDGMETVNGTVAGRVTADKARRLNRSRYRLAETGGSDAHFIASIGSAYTAFPGRTAAELKHALMERRTSAHFGRPVGLRQIGLHRLLLQPVRGLVVHPARLLGRSLWRRWVRRDR